MMLERGNCGIESEPMLMFIFPDRSLAQAVNLVSYLSHFDDLPGFGSRALLLAGLS
jgi:hypothetical protein